MSFETRDIGTSTAASPPGRRVPAWVWAVVAFVLGMALTLWLANAEKHRSRNEARRVFVQETRDVAVAIHQQLDQCGHLIRAFQSIFLASQTVTEIEYARAYENMQSNGAARVALQALAYAERRRQADGDHYVTTMFAPQSGNLAIRGLDVNSQPSNLRSLEYSRDTDELAMSAPFALRQSGRQSLGDGFILRLPVFASGTQPGTVQARRAAIIGSIGASFRISDLIASALPESPEQLADLVVEDVSAGAARPLYSKAFAGRGNGAAHSEHAVSLQFGGRTWKVVAHGADPAGGSWQLVLWIGAAMSALLAALTWSLVSTRERAIALGTSMARRFQASEERFRKLNELLPCLVLLAREDDGTIVYRNAFARDRLAPDTQSARLSDVLGQEVMVRLAAADADTLLSVDAQLPGADGGGFWASLWLSTIELDGAPMWLLVASDVSEQRQLTERLSYQASHDSLTRLYNRREFEARAQSLLNLPGRGDGALLFIDLDQFKIINDTSGHCAGDELLVQLAAVMREKLRPGDVLGRLGGDEFGVLLRGAPTVEAALLAAERLRISIEGFIFSWEQRTYTISASIGVVMLAHATTLRELFAHADAACYLAKDGGRNRVHVYAEDDTAISRRLGEMEWANRIREALRDGRLLLDYQELHPLQPGPAEGAHVELLLRLRGEDGGVVPPGAFLPAAERYGLMPLIDRWVVETALGNLDRIHPHGSRLATCAINLSGGSLEDDGLFARIEQLIELHGIEPRRLVFEVTETVAVRNFIASSALIARLRSLGCRVALDDFGAGMSSFGYLKNLELAMLKIDGSFVQNLTSDRMSQSIVKAVTEIGHQQGLIVVAEWVSTQEMLDILVPMNVDYAQGFALHKPERAVFQRSADQRNAHG